MRQNLPSHYLGPVSEFGRPLNQCQGGSPAGVGGSRDPEVPGREEEGTLAHLSPSPLGHAGAVCVQTRRTRGHTGAPAQPPARRVA